MESSIRIGWRIASTVLLAAVVSAPLVTATFAGPLGSGAGRSGAWATLERGGRVKPAPNAPFSALAKNQARQQLGAMDRAVTAELGNLYGGYLKPERLRAVQMRPTSAAKMDVVDETAKAAIARERVAMMGDPALRISWGDRLHGALRDHLASAVSNPARGSLPREAQLIGQLQRDLGTAPLAEAFFKGNRKPLAAAFDARYGKSSYFTFIELMKRPDREIALARAELLLKGGR